MPQLRQNIVTGDWVVIAPERAKRPSDFVTSGMVRHDQPDTCPFCPGSSAWKTRYRQKGDETNNLYIIPNKYPAFVPSEEQCERRSFPTEEFYRTKGAVGGHDVVVLKDHHLSPMNLPQAVMSDLLCTIQHRYLHYREVSCRPEYTMAIYNYGPEAGASIWHPHAQIFASAVVPNLISAEHHGAEAYFGANGVCVFCDLLEHERTTKTRLQVETEHFVSFTFYAARFPFELWVLPKQHQSRYELTPKHQLEELAELLRTLLHRLDRTLNNPPLNLFLHSLPNTLEAADDYHWHLEIAPRVATYGGFELGGQMIIDVVSPELAAQFLRENRHK